MNQNQTFEAALQKLNAIVEQLESGELSLEKSLKLFEEGAALAAFCNQKLESARQKVRQISEPEKTEEKDGQQDGQD